MQPYQLPSAAFIRTNFMKLSIIHHDLHLSHPLTYWHTNTWIAWQILQKQKNPSRYPSRFGVIPHDFLTTLHQILHKIVERLAMDSIRERLRFHVMKHFVSYHETVRSKRRNTSFHPVKRTDTLWFNDFSWPLLVLFVRRVDSVKTYL